MSFFRQYKLIGFLVMADSLVAVRFARFEILEVALMKIRVMLDV
jgi:hypothetical protein